jgi:DNA-directed RNA polymerase specialized sigma24 family protein
MKDDNREIRFALQSWGAYKRRSFAALNYPSSISAFNSKHHEPPVSEPNWKRKHISENDEYKFRQRKQISTRPKRKQLIPSYIGNKYVNMLDIAISELPKLYRDHAEFKYVYELKDVEIAEKASKTVKAIEKRTSKLYCLIKEKLEKDRI